MIIADFLEKNVVEDNKTQMLEKSVIYERYLKEH